MGDVAFFVLAENVFPPASRSAPMKRSDGETIGSWCLFVRPSSLLCYVVCLNYDLVVRPADCCNICLSSSVPPQHVNFIALYVWCSSVLLIH